MKDIAKTILLALVVLPYSARAAILTVSVDPGLVRASPGQSFSIDIVGSLAQNAGFDHLASGYIALRFDPSIIHPAAVNPVSLASDFGFFNPSLSLQIDPGLGLISMDLNASSLLGSPPSLSPPPPLTDLDPATPGRQFRFATIDLVADRPGLSGLALSLLKPDGHSTGSFSHFPFATITDTDIAFASGSIEVVPVPAAAWLMLSGLGLIGLRMARRT